MAAELSGHEPYPGSTKWTNLVHMAPRRTVNVHEAKTSLSELLVSVESGEEIIIARNGKPIAKLSPVARGTRKPGRLRGRIRMRRDFEAPLPADLLEAFGSAGK